MQSPSPSTSANSTSTRISVWSTVITFAVLVLFMLGGAFAAMPATVMTTDFPRKADLVALVPESWEFFTRDPKTPSLVLQEIVKDEGTITEAGTLPQTRHENGFGLSRNQRSQDTEKAIIAAAVPNWVECGGMTTLQCLHVAREGSFVAVPGVSGDANFCGKFLLGTVETTRFNYRDISPGQYLSKVAAVEVVCESES